MGAETKTPALGEHQGQVSSSGQKELTEEPKIWLDAWFDPAADLHAFSGSTCLAGDALYVGDLSGILKIFDGSRRKAGRDVRLHGVPTAVRAFFDDGKSVSGEANIAVACGPSVFVYHKMKPFFKFTIDPPKIQQLELDVWEKLRARAIDASQVCQLLRGQPNLSERSLELLALETDPDRLERFLAEELSGNNFRTPSQTCITCLEVLRKRDDGDPRGPGLLVLGTESCKVLLLDPSLRAVVRSVSLRSTPVFIAVTGSLDVEYRIVVACRNKRIYSIKSGDLVRRAIELESPVCGGVVRLARDIIVGCMDHTIHSFHIKGRKNWTLHMPAPITSIAPFMCERASTSGFLVALRDGQVRLYIEKTLMSTIRVEGQVVTALVFGQFNREPNTLLMLFTSGALGVKMLKRTAKLDPHKAPRPGPPPEQDVPLAVPKKTRLYIDQTQRERESAVDMHRAFQHSLCKLRYVTARSYVRLFEHSGSANAQTYTSANHYIQSDDVQERLSLSAQVLGLGPRLRLVAQLENVGALAVLGATLSLHFDRDAYHVSRAAVTLNALVPGHVQQAGLDIEALSPGASAPPVQLVILRGPTVLVSALVDMPMVEPAL